jgi:FtsP/CotA-like multicopper oxidase with cupredoxin domain
VLPNDNGGTMTGDQFTLTLTPKAGGTAVINGVDPAPTTTTTTLGAGISNSNVSAGVYVVAESPASTTGYTSAWTCTGGTLTGNELTVTNGATVTCYVVNDDQPAAVTLHKVVTNDNGGTATGSEFTLTLTPKAGGTAVINGADPAPTTTTTTLGAGISANISAGTYVLGETTTLTGYTGSSWTCTGGTLAGNELTVTNGATVTCYVVNDDQPAAVTLHKVVTNDNGGTATGSEFTLTLTPKAGGTAVINGADPAPTTTTTTLGAGISANISAGTYVLGETTTLTGYTGSSWTCTGGTLAGNELTVTNGATVTCYVVNDDQPATVTLHKVLPNDNGGTMTGDQFTLTLTPKAGGTAVINGVDPAPTTTTTTLGAGISNSNVSAGVYVVAESPASTTGYTSAWTCTGGTLTGNELTVTNGATVTCYVVNDDQPAAVTLHKVAAPTTTAAPRPA